MNSSEFVNVFVFVAVVSFVFYPDLIGNTMDQRRLSSFFVDNFEPLLCQKYSASDTDLS